MCAVYSGRDHSRNGAVSFLFVFSLIRYNRGVNQEQLYQAMDATTPEDLLRHFPSRYESLVPSAIEFPLVDGRRYVVKGVAEQIKSVEKYHCSIIRFQIPVVRNKLSCMVFNQPFYISKLRSNATKLFVLYYSEARHYCVVSAIYDLDSPYVISGIKPCYSLPKAVSPSFFSSEIRKILAYPMGADLYHSTVPNRYREKYKLIDEYSAFRNVHMPRSEEDLHAGLRVFKYEDALSYCINSLKIKQNAAKRKRTKKTAISHEMVNQFVRELPFKLTGDQLTCIRDIVLDMESDTIMFRLLQGDVGTGKTIVSFATLYANYLRGLQGVLIAPTFELAAQHYQKALKIFERYSIKVRFLSGTQSASDKQVLLQDLKEKRIDILIGTHAALSDKVSFSALGLAIIDEQQLFGVRQREELIEKGPSVDFLMMSATPIPRTLSQIIHSDVSVSTLLAFPNGQRNVKTGVVRSTDPIIDQAVKKAIAAHRQVFVVAPKIEEGTKKTSSSSAVAVFRDFSKRYGEDQVQLLHGRIKKEEQEKIYRSFLENEKPILVATTVVEVGIDVSSAGLLIVYDANCFGLSSLHQLRGRIGRSGDFALALFVYDGSDKESQEKLNFLANNTDGLKISEFDLGHRGAGIYSGEKQSGKGTTMVANFVNDLQIYQVARENAEEILKDPQEPENAAYLKTIADPSGFFIA